MTPMEITYSELTLAIDTLGESVDDLEGELVLSDVEVLEAFEATKVREEGADSFLVANHIVFECK